MDIDRAKFNMVEQQIRPWNVIDQQVLNTMSAVERDRFVPEQYRELAFADINIPIGDGQVMLQPKVEARLIQALELKKTDTVLQIGAGTGHVAALLANLCAQVDAVDIRDQFVSLATSNLQANGFENVRVFHGDASQGWESETRYDCIFISGSFIHLPQAFALSLPVGGRLTAFVGEHPLMDAIIIRRTGESVWDTSCLFETSIQPLDHIDQPDRFVF